MGSAHVVCTTLPHHESLDVLRSPSREAARAAVTDTLRGGYGGLADGEATADRRIAHDKPRPGS
jgi:hypothetical protein